MFHDENILGMSLDRDVCMYVPVLEIYVTSETGCSANEQAERGQNCRRDFYTATNFRINRRWCGTAIYHCPTL